LIHEVGQLGGTEELLDRSRYRADVDQSLRRQIVLVLDRHALLDHALQPCQSDADLVLQKFTHAAQTPVAQVIDVVGRAQAVIDVQKVGERSHHVVGIDIFGQKAGSRRAQGCGQGVCVLVARVLVQDLHQCGIMDVLIEFQFPGVQSKGFQVDGGVHKEVADAAHHTAVQGHVHAADAGVLDSAGQLTVDAVPRGGDEFPRARVHHGGGQALARDADAQVQFLVDFITSHARQVIAPRVKKEGGQKALRGFHRRRFARAQALINLQ